MAATEIKVTRMAVTPGGESKVLSTIGQLTTAVFYLARGWREAGERLSRGGREKAANMIEVIDVNAKTTKRTIVLDVIYALEVELLHLLPIQQVNQRYLKPVHH